MIDRLLPYLKVWIELFNRRRIIVKFNSQNTQNIEEVENGRITEISGSQVSGKFRLASATSDLRNIIEAGQIIAELSPLYIDGLELHPMARTASHNVLSVRLFNAVRIAAELDSENFAGAKTNLTAMSWLVQGSNPKKAREIYDDKRFQTYLSTWAIFEATKMARNIFFKAGRKNADDDVIHDIAIKAYMALIREQSLKGNIAKKDAFQLLRTHKVDYSATNNGSDILQTLRTYLFDYVKGYVLANLKQGNPETSASQLGALDKDGNAKSIEDFDGGKADSPEQIVLNNNNASTDTWQKIVSRISQNEEYTKSIGIISRQLRERITDMDKDLGIIENKIMSVSNDVDPEAAKKRTIYEGVKKQILLKKKTILNFAKPLSDELVEIAGKIESIITDTNLNPIQKRVRTQALKEDYATKFVELGHFADREEGNDIEIPDFDAKESQENEIPDVDKPKFKTRPSAQIPAVPAGVPADISGVSSDIAPEGIVSAPQKSKITATGVIRKGKIVVGDNEFWAVHENAQRTSKTLMPYLYGCLTYSTNKQLASMSSKLLYWKSLSNSISSPEELQMVLSDNPEIRAQASPKALYANTAAKVSMVLRDLYFFDRKYTPQTEPTDKTPVGYPERWAAMIFKLTQEDPALIPHAKELQGLLTNETAFRTQWWDQMDYYSRAAAYDRARIMVAGGKPWSELKPEDLQSISTDVFELLYDNDYRPISIRNEKEDTKVANRVGYNSNPDDRKAKLEILTYEPIKVVEHKLSKQTGKDIVWAYGTSNTSRGALKDRVIEVDHDVAPPERRTKKINPDFSAQGGENQNNLGVSNDEQNGENVSGYGNDASIGLTDGISDGDIYGDELPLNSVNPWGTEQKEEAILAKRIDLLIRLGSRLEKEGKVRKAAKVANMILELL